MAKKRPEKDRDEKREISNEQLIRGVKIILDSDFFIPDLITEEFYRRLHDDHDGTFSGGISVSVDRNGDVWLNTDGQRSLRFRTSIGGGQSLRVRTALTILALAIKLDNEERPQEMPIGKKDE